MMYKNKAVKDIIFWGLMIISGILLFTVIIPNQIPMSARSASETITPRTLPYILSIALSFVALIGIITSAVNYVIILKGNKTTDTNSEIKKHITKHELYKAIFPFMVFALIVIYAILFKKIGYIWSALIVPPIILFILNCRKWYMYLILYAFSAIIYFLFTLVLNVPLP